MIRTVVRFITVFLIILFLSPSLFSQADVKLVYPENEIIHYKEVPPGLEGRAFTVQEWRRDQRDKKLEKGANYIFNQQGQLIRLETAPEVWSYQYNNAGLPSRIDVETGKEGDYHYYAYSYHDDHFALEKNTAKGKTSRIVFFTDKEGRIVEKKSYSAPESGGKLVLDQRILYTYKDGLKNGEMHYNYITENKKPKVQQVKKIFSYDSTTGLLSQVQSFQAITYPKGYRAKKASDFTVVTQQIDYTYDPATGNLLTKTKKTSPTLWLEQQWTNTYHANGRVHHRRWESYNLQGQVVSWSEASCDDHGGVKGFKIDKKGMGAKAYRSSFVVE